MDFRHFQAAEQYIATADDGWLSVAGMMCRAWSSGSGFIVVFVECLSQRIHIVFVQSIFPADQLADPVRPGVVIDLIGVRSCKSSSISALV